MDISGKIIAVLETRTGVSQRTGTEWKVASYVLETVEQYPKKVCFEVFGSDRIGNFNIQANQYLTVSMDIDAHENNGRWYNTIRAWRVVPYDPNAPQVVPAPVAAPAPQVAPAPEAAPAATDPFASGQPTDDLPF